MYNQQNQCEHCGLWHNGVCHLIKSIEYHPNGTIKKIEYHKETTNENNYIQAKSLCQGSV